MELRERMRWAAFRKWNEHLAQPVDLDELASVIGDLRAEISEHTLTKVLESKAFNNAEERYVQFCQSLGPNGQLWSSYLDIVGLLLQFTRSTREAKWKLHVECLLELLPWFCAYDRSNYARYLPVYVLYTCFNCQLHIPQLIGNWLLVSLPSKDPEATCVAAYHMTKRLKSPSTRTPRPKEVSSA